MTKPTLLILAAGMGSRYGGLKQIDPVGPAGETIIDYSIYDALRAGFGKLVFVIRHDFEQAFKEIVGARFEKRVAGGIRFSGIGHAAAGIFRSRRSHQAVGHHTRDSSWPRTPSKSRSPPSTRMISTGGRRIRCLHSI